MMEGQGEKEPGQEKQEQTKEDQDNQQEVGPPGESQDDRPQEEPYGAEGGIPKDPSVTSKRVAPFNSKMFTYQVNECYHSIDSTSKAINSISNTINYMIEVETPFNVVRLEHKAFTEQLDSFLAQKEKFNGLIERAGSTVTDEDFNDYNMKLDIVKRLEWKFNVDKKFFEDYFSKAQVQQPILKSKSKGSKTSKSKCSGSTAYSLTQNKLKNMQRKADLDAKEKELKLKREFEEKEAQLRYRKEEQEIEIMKANVEEKLIIQENLEKELNSSQGTLSEESLSVKSNVICNSRKGMNQDVLPQVSDFKLSRPKVDDDKYYSTPKRYGDLTQTASLLPNNDTSIMMIINEMRKPQVNIQPFKGDPMQYNTFISQFNNKIIQYCSKYECYDYLLQYTEGEAQRLVQTVATLDPRLRYQEALKALEKKFGNKDAVAHAYIQRALEWPTIKPNDGKALDEFSMFIEECKHAMVSIEAVKILENPENMRKLVMKLPSNMHDKWRHFVRKKGDYSTRIYFKDLAMFIDNESVAANHPVYGKAHMVVEKSNTGQQTGAKQKTKKVFATTDTGIGSTNKEGSESTQVDKKSEKREEGKDKVTKAFKPCLHCKGEHRLAHCKKIETLESDKKLDYLRENKLCFKCLKKGHFSTEM